MSDEKIVTDVVNPESLQEELAIHLSGEVDDDNATYTTGQIADMTNRSHDMIRYYANEFADFLELDVRKKKKGRHLRFNRTDVETLRLIVQLLDTNHTPAEIKSILSDETMKMMIVGAEDKGLTALLTKNNQLLLEAVKTVMVQSVEKVTEKLQDDYERNLAIERENVKLLEHALEEEKEFRTQLLEKMELQDEQIKRILEQTEKKKKKGWFSK